METRKLVNSSAGQLPPQKPLGLYTPMSSEAVLDCRSTLSTQKLLVLLHDDFESVAGVHTPFEVLQKRTPLPHYRTNLQYDSYSLQFPLASNMPDIPDWGLH